MSDFERPIDDPGGPGGQDVEERRTPPGDTADNTGGPAEPHPAELDLPGPDDPVAWNYVRPGTAVVGPEGRRIGRVVQMLGTEDEGIFHGVAVGPEGGGPTRVVRADPKLPGLLYAGTETGVWVSLDDGGSWQRLRAGLPVAPIHDLIVKDTDLVVATHGRAFWILDDLTPLHQLAAAPPDDVHLFAPRPTIRWRAYKGHGMKPGPAREVGYRMAGSVGYAYRLVEAPTGENTEKALDAGENPPSGVIVHYWLKEPASGDVTLTFLDAYGYEIRTFTSRREPRRGTPVSAPAVATGGE